MTVLQSSSRHPSRLRTERSTLHPAAPPTTAQWFAAVMGTGILAVAFTLSPVHNAAVATGAWLLASILLVVVLAVGVRALRRDAGALIRAVCAPGTLPFLGAVPMAVLTVGHGALVAGSGVIGAPAALLLDQICWTVGTVLGLGTLVGVTWVMVRRDGLGRSSVTGAHLMPVVPPMVSAATAATLISHGSAASGLLLVLGVALFVIALGAALPVLGWILARLVGGPAIPSAQMPSVVIPLGVLGQSATAALGLSGQAGPQWRTVGVVVATSMLTLALIWSIVAVILLLRAVRGGMRGSLGWWAFTFPVGTCVTGAGSLATVTGSAVATVGSTAALMVLVLGWLLAATATVRLLRPVPVVA